MGHVVFILYHPEFGGPHNQALRLAGPLKESGWTMTVVLPEEARDPAGRLSAAGIPVVRMPLKRARATSNPRVLLTWVKGFREDVDRLRGLIERVGADIVLSCGMVNIQPVFAARRAKVPLVWQIVDTRSPALVRGITMCLVQRYAAALMTTGVLVASQHPGARRFGSRLVPFFPPVDTDAFSPSVERKRAARTELGIPDGAFVVGNVSNINPQKGHPTFVQAAALLHAIRPEAKFVILGAPYQHYLAYTDALWSEASRLGLQIGRDLIIRNPGARVAELAACFDVFWLTSEPRSEGIPTVVEEAMSLGIPPVASNVGSVTELVEDGVSGFIVEPRNPKAFVDATIKLMDQQDLRTTMAEAARRSAVSKAGVVASRDAHVHAFECAVEFAGVRNQSRVPGRDGPIPAGAGESKWGQ